MKLITTIAATACLLSSARGLAGQEAESPPDVAASPQSSSVAELEPTAVQIGNLWKLGKVWGFLKYHHPLIAGGEVDWDQELFTALPLVLGAEAEEEGVAAIGVWAESFPAPEPASPAWGATEDSHLQPDLDWIHDREALGEALCSYLEAVHTGRFGGDEQAYVQTGPGVGNPIFNGERAYADLDGIDAGYRLLALFRLWNIIQWWSPYRDQLDSDWDTVLVDCIPRFLAADSRDTYGVELLALAALVKDTHTNIGGLSMGPPPYGAGALPVVIRFVGNRAIVFRTLETSREGKRLQQGDVLVAMDGKTVAELVEEVAPLYPASNQPARLSRISRKLTLGPEGDVLVRVERAGEEIEFLTRRESHDPGAAYRLGRHERPGPAFQLLDEDVAYVKLSSARVKDVGRYLEDARSTKGLVIDIRNYPDEFMILYELGGHLVKEKTPFATFTRSDWRTPGTTAWEGMSQLSPKSPYYSGQVVILADESSISRAEFTAMAYQSAPRALVVGSTTAGADGNVSSIPLPGDHRSWLSGIGVFYPDQTPTQRSGIRIDVPCVPTVEGIRQGRDEVLEEAVRQILGEDGTDERVRRITR